MDDGALTLEYVRARTNLRWVQREFGCSGGCTEVFEAFLESPSWACTGGPNVSRLGNWVGHIFPGTLFILWASHWLLGFVRQHYAALSQRQPYRSTTCFRFLWLPQRWPLEAVAKTLFPVLAISLELWLAHSEGYRNLICARGTHREGHINGDTVINWQHAYMYPGFIASGLVDLISLKLEPPPGTSQAFLALAFLHETVLFGLHKKHAPMDVLVHQLLACSGLACALFPALEAAWADNPLLTAGRVAATYLHGAWFIAAAHMMYEDHDAWDLSDSEDRNQKTDIGPVLYAPLLFLTLAMATVLGITAVLLLAGVCCYRPHLSRRVDAQQQYGEQQAQQDGGTVAATRAGPWSLERGVQQQYSQQRMQQDGGTLLSTRAGPWPLE